MKELLPLADEVKRIVIDRELESLRWHHPLEELYQLETEAIASGFVVAPIIVWNGILIDGHESRQIVLRNPRLHFRLYEMSFMSRNEMLIWFCKNQLSQSTAHAFRCYLIGKLYALQKIPNGNRLRFKGSKDRSLLDHRTTRDRLADEYQVSSASIARAERFAKGLDAAETERPGIKQEVLTGAIRPSKHFIEAIALTDSANRKQMIEELCFGLPIMKQTSVRHEKELPSTDNSIQITIKITIEGRSND